MKEGKEDMPLVGKTMAEGHTHRMAVLCEKLGSTLREILDGTCPQPAKPEKAPKRPALEKYRETYLIPPKIKGPKAVFISEETRSALDMIVLRLGCRGMSVSGLLENLARRHLETYRQDIERWRKLFPDIMPDVHNNSYTSSHFHKGRGH